MWDKHVAPFTGRTSSLEGFHFCFSAIFFNGKEVMWRGDKAQMVLGNGLHLRPLPGVGGCAWKVQLHNSPVCLLVFLNTSINNFVVRQGSQKANDDSQVMGEEWWHNKDFDWPWKCCLLRKRHQSFITMCPVGELPRSENRPSLYFFCLLIFEVQSKKEPRVMLLRALTPPLPLLPPG